MTILIAIFIITLECVELNRVPAWQKVIDADLDPAAEAPEAEPEDPRILVVRTPLLILVVRNHL